jgi:hypothetical protein
MKVPDIDCNDAHVPRVNLLLRDDDFARGRITRLKAQFYIRGPDLHNGEERISQNEDSARGAWDKPAEQKLAFHGDVENRNCQ